MGVKRVGVRLRARDRSGGSRVGNESQAEVAEIVAQLERLVAQRQNPRHTGRPLGNLLVGRGHLHASELDYALQLQTASGQRLGEIVVALGLVSEEAVVEVLAEQFKMDVLDRNRIAVDVSTARLISATDSRRLRALPLRERQGVFDVAVAEPASRDLTEALVRHLHAPVRLYLTTPSLLAELVGSVHGADEPLDCDSTDTREAVSRCSARRDEGS
jgi:hypothetical protein